MSRGFGAMDREKQREISARGGKAAHAAGRAHTWDGKQAKEAGSAGGRASVERRRCRHCGEVIPWRRDGGGLAERACSVGTRAEDGAVLACEVRT
jgi:general stress protein YciG